MCQRDDPERRLLRAVTLSYIAALSVLAVWTALCVAALLWAAYEVIRVIGWRMW